MSRNPTQVPFPFSRVKESPERIILKIMSARHFIAGGRVQGVGFRWFAMRRARSLDLSGWVRNLPDGTVEAWAEGPDDELDAFEAALREGPPGALVRSLRSEPAAATGACAGFDVTF